MDGIARRTSRLDAQGLMLLYQLRDAALQRLRQPSQRGEGRVARRVGLQLADKRLAHLDALGQGPLRQAKLESEAFHLACEDHCHHGPA